MFHNTGYAISVYWKRTHRACSRSTEFWASSLLVGQPIMSHELMKNPPSCHLQAFPWAKAWWPHHSWRQHVHWQGVLRGHSCSHLCCWALAEQRCLHGTGTITVWTFCLPSDLPTHSTSAIKIHSPVTEVSFVQKHKYLHVFTYTQSCGELMPFVGIHTCNTWRPGSHGPKQGALARFRWSQIWHCSSNSITGRRGIYLQIIGRKCQGCEKANGGRACCRQIALEQGCSVAF